MKKTTLKFIVLLVLLFVSCAYFNTFYNAKQYYRKGYLETKKRRTSKPTSGERTNYTKAIDKALKLIEFYPKSKYVDDALMLLGKSYYFLGEYIKARRKFIELRTNYPRSGLRMEADLWLGKTYLALNQLDDAEREFRRLINRKVSKKIKGEAYFYLGKLYERNREFEKALHFYHKAVKESLGDKRAEVLFTIAADYDSLGDYEKSAEFFQRVLKANPSAELRFEAQVRYAEIKERQNDLDSAIHLLEKLLADEKNKQWIPELRLEIAYCLTLKGDINGAILAYEDIIQAHKKTKYSAEARYMLGKIFEENKKDYGRALEQFSQVRTEYRNSPYADSANVRKLDILRLQALRQVIDMAQKGKEGELALEAEKTPTDTLTDEKLYAMVDSATTDSARLHLLSRVGGKVFADSVRKKPNFSNRNETFSKVRETVFKRNQPQIDWNVWVEDGIIPQGVDLIQELKKLRKRFKESEKSKMVINPELKTFRVEELDKNLLLLAELYLFRFSLPDSAINQYKQLITRFPNSPYAPQALYNLGYILRKMYNKPEASDSCYHNLIVKYPQSSFANAARELLGLPKVKTKEDSIRAFFEEGEKLLFEKNDPSEALKKYKLIWEKFPNSNLAPKALYSMGWIYEMKLDSSSMAMALYDSLIAQYPETVYAKKVREKVQAVKIEKSTKAKSKGKISTETKKIKQKVPVEEGMKENQFKEPAKIKDRLNETASPIGGIEAIQNRLVFPKGIDQKKLVSLVVLKIYVDADGQAKDLSMERSSGVKALDESILKIIRETKFKPAYREGKPVSSWVKLSIPLGQKEARKFEK